MPVVKEEVFFAVTIVHHPSISFAGNDFINSVLLGEVMLPLYKLYTPHRINYPCHPVGEARVGHWAMVHCARQGHGPLC